MYVQLVKNMAGNLKTEYLPLITEKYSCNYRGGLAHLKDVIKWKMEMIWIKTAVSCCQN